MKISVNFTRAILGLGLASSLFLGCEQFLGQGADKTTPADTDKTVNTAPADVALQLAVKQTADCKSMRDRVLAAHAAGEAPGTLETEFITKCIEEVKPSAGAGTTITVPADLLPDNLTRCRWIVAQIEGGHDELVIKFRYYCPDDCDSLAVKDSVRHVKLCRDPAPDCATLKKQLSAMDSTTEEFARLRRFLHEHCGVLDPTRPKDTVIVKPPMGYCDSLRHLLATVKGDSVAEARIRHELAAKCPVVEPKPDPAMSPCDSLRKKLASLDPASEDYRKLKAMFIERCEKPRDTVIVPKPDPIPAPCDSLRKLLSSLDPASEAYARVKHQLAEKCEIVPKPEPVPTTCDSLHKKLASLDPASPEYAKTKEYFRLRCEVPRDTVIIPKPEPVPTTCDSLRKQLSTMDPASPEYAKMKEYYRLKCEVPRDTVVKPQPVPTTCDSLRKRLAGMDPASPDYARLKQYYAEKCTDVKPVPVDPKPIEPKPVDPKPVSNCEAYRMKLASVPADSADAAYIRGLIAKECAEPVK